MLARTNRLVSADDYRRLVRRGRRVVGEHTVVYVSQGAGVSPVRFGFIVPKTVGVAVKRNLVRRRLKALSRESIELTPAGTEIVIRALPGAAQVSWDTLRSEVSHALAKGVTQA